MIGLYILGCLICVGACHVIVRYAEIGHHRDMLLYHLYRCRGILHGIPTQYVSDAATARQILRQTSTIGHFLKHSIGLRSISALPLYGIVDILDGDEWVVARRHFITFIHTLPSMQTLHESSVACCHEVVMRSTPISTHDVNTLVLRITIKWMYPTLPEPEQRALASEILPGLLQYRKELFLRGFGQYAIQRHSMDCIQSRLGIDENIAHMVMYLCLIINVNTVDVFIRSRYLQTNVTETIIARHPTQYVERYLTTSVGKIPAGTQVLIDLESIIHADPANTRWAMFGVGPRTCPGQYIALSILEPMTEILHASEFPHKTHSDTTDVNPYRIVMRDHLVNIWCIWQFIWKSHGPDG